MDAETLRARLLALREDNLARMAELGLSRQDIVEASHDANIDDEHDPEGATIAYERSMLQALMAQTSQRLSAIDIAIARVASGDYDTCLACGGPIGEARLDAQPTTVYCRKDA